MLPYVPSRLEEGHGLSMAAVAAAERAGVTLIVTVDTGSTSVAEVAAAGRLGIDVVITDHHHLPDVLPAAVALVNPHRADSAYPDPGLSGSGVAFTVSRLLLGELDGAAGDALELADLATIGTVSDVAPILGENRAIAKLGLERMRTSPRPGHRGAPRARRRVRRRRSTSRRSASCLRRASTPPAGWGRRSMPRGCCSPRRPRRRRSWP